MGIFSRGPKVPLTDKIRAKAEKAGVGTDGALAILNEFKDGQESYLLVFPDRVDVVHMKKIGTLFGSGGAGVESYPIGSISSVSIRPSGLWSFLVLTGSNFEVEFRGLLSTSPAAREAILQAKRLS